MLDSSLPGVAMLSALDSGRMEVVMRVVCTLTGVCAGIIVAAAAFAIDLPVKAKQAKGEFVTAYDECSASTTFTNPPFALPGCIPVRTNPLCGFGPSGTGKYSAKVKASDIAAQASWNGLDAGCEGTTLYLVADIRMTTSDCSGGDCTMIDLPAFSLGQCTVTLGRCTIKSTLEKFEGIGTSMLKDGQTYSIALDKICAYSLVGSANAFCAGLKVQFP